MQKVKKKEKFSLRDMSAETDYIYNELDKNIDLSITGLYPYTSELNEFGMPKYRYESKLEIIDFDEEFNYDICSGHGFIVTSNKSIKKDLVSDNTIYSDKFGMGYNDVTPFGDVYKCKCGHTTMKINEGIICEVCHTPVKYVSSDFSMTGWIKVEEPCYVIQPAMFKKIKSFIGKNKFDEILIFNAVINEDGFITIKEPPKNNPYAGIGMLEFRNKFDEIIEYFRKKYKSNNNKMNMYMDIIDNRHKIFAHSVPVYTLQLRPIHKNKNALSFEGNNALFHIMSNLAKRMNDSKMSTRGREKSTNDLLYKFQMKYMEIYIDLEKLIAQKKGYIRSLNGGRYNFTARNVIIPDPELAIDEIILPYTTLIELLGLTIVNILTKTYSPCEAYRIWDEARIKYNPMIGKLIQSILDSEYIGIILNRNPSISPSSIIQLHVIGVTQDETYSCRVPHEILTSMNADFDGDTLNILLIINKQFLISAAYLFNPRLSMQISPNDGLFNSNMQLQTDTMICINSFAQIGIDEIDNEDDLDLIYQCQSYCN